MLELLCVLIGIGLGAGGMATVYLAEVGEGSMAVMYVHKYLQQT